MKKILIIIAAVFIVGNTYAQTWLPGPPLRIKDGTDTIDVNGVFSKYTTAFLKDIRGNVGISTNTDDTVLVLDKATKTIKKKLIAGGGGGAATDTTNKFINSIAVKNDSVITYNRGGNFTDIPIKGATDRLTNSLLNYVKLTDTAALVAPYNSWRKSGNDIYNNNTGNVGIGMLPTNKLDVLGDIGSRPVNGASQMKVYYDANGFVSLRYGGGKTGLYWGSVDQYFNGVNTTNFNTFMNTILPGVSNVFEIAGVEKMRLDNVGNLGIGTASPNSTLSTNGSIATTLISKNANYTVTAADNTINVTTVGVTITLPTAIGIQGREYTIINSTSGNITITTTASQTIGNFVTTTSFTLATDKALKVQSDNTNYKIKGQF